MRLRTFSCLLRGPGQGLFVACNCSVTNKRRRSQCWNNKVLGSASRSAGQGRAGGGRKQGIWQALRGTRSSRGRCEHRPTKGFTRCRNREASADGTAVALEAARAASTVFAMAAAHNRSRSRLQAPVVVQVEAPRRGAPPVRALLPSGRCPRQGAPAVAWGGPAHPLWSHHGVAAPRQARVSSR